MSRVRRYVLDTNVLINAFRDAAANDWLQAFHQAHAPGEYLSSVVIQELLAGVRSPKDRRKLERHWLHRFEAVKRVVTPSPLAWRRSGDVLRALRMREGLELAPVSKSLGNDVLLALSCREVGMVLVTDNVRDFEPIARVVRFEFVEP